MVKGISHRVIVVKSPDRYFEEAIFVIRDDLLNDSGADRAAVLKEARRVANSYVLGTKKKGVSFISRLPAPVFAAAGAAAAGIAWFAMRLVGV
ncbi:MAG: translation initiation factor 2 [Oscillospiraceae bacterium]